MYILNSIKLSSQALICERFTKKRKITYITVRVQVLKLNTNKCEGIQFRNIQNELFIIEICLNFENKRINFHSYACYDEEEKDYLYLSHSGAWWTHPGVRWILSYFNELFSRGQNHSKYQWLCSYQLNVLYKQLVTDEYYIKGLLSLV